MKYFCLFFSGVGSESSSGSATLNDPNYKKNVKKDHPMDRDPDPTSDTDMDPDLSVSFKDPHCEILVDMSYPGSSVLNHYINRNP